MMSQTEQFECSTEGMMAAQAFLERNCVEPKPAIIMDEIVSNIVRCSGAKQFEVTFERSDDAISLVFTDDGRAFDPLNEVADPDINAAVGDRQIGGLGIFMVKKMAKSVNYERRDGKNVLTVALPA